MNWLTERKLNAWYVKVTCQKCRDTTVVFPDPSNGQDEFSLNYFFSCPSCQHQGTHEAERYWYPYSEVEL